MTEDREHEAVFARHVVGLDGLRLGCQQVQEGLVVARRVAEPDEGRDAEPEPFRVHDGRVPGDDPPVFKPAHPLGDGAGRHGHGPGQLGVTGPPVLLQDLQDAHVGLIEGISGHK